MTAYETRISDWSSDVCSSDLIRRARWRVCRVCTVVTADSPDSCALIEVARDCCSSRDMRACSTCVRRAEIRALTSVALPGCASALRARYSCRLSSASVSFWWYARTCLSMNSYASRLSRSLVARRSEEHTSELQSLMRISYAVFCLKKKNNTLTRINS